MNVFIQTKDHTSVPRKSKELEKNKEVIHSQYEPEIWGLNYYSKTDEDNFFVLVWKHVLKM